jgi:diguanylate cyclase (GGDEF)-like protein
VSEWDESTDVGGEPSVRGPGGRDRAYVIVLTGLNVGEMFRVGENPLVVGRGDDAGIKLSDDAVSRRHASLQVIDGHAFVEDLGSRNGTWINGERIQAGARPLRDGDKIQIGSATVLKFTFHDEYEESFQRRMFESSLRDPLTRAFNKRYLLGRLESEFRFASRHQQPLSLLLMDIDHFKKVNDGHGHLAGDQVLAEMARKVHDSIRNEDVFARYGGEEFAVLCRSIELDKAAAFADRLRRAVEGQEHLFDGQTIKITVSVGVAGLPLVEPHTGDDPLELMAAADDALYAAKKAGRNCVHTTGGPHRR